MLASTWWLNTKKILQLIRLQPFDATTPNGRAQERHRRVILSAIASVAARGISILTALVSVPLVINYLGAERYGLWLIMTSFLGILSFADLGLGNGLINAISEANGKDDRLAARRYVSNALFMLATIALLLGMSFGLLYQSFSWQQIFNISSPLAIAEAGPAMIVFMLCFLINMPLGIVQRVQMGYQEAFKNSIWLGMGNVLGLVNVLVVIGLRAGLPWLVLALAGTPILTTILNGLVLFGHQRPWLRPRWTDLNAPAVKYLLRIGILFFALQIASAIGYQTDNIVIARILGPAAVPNYAVPMKLFALAPVILGFVLVPLWPAYGEAIARHDIRWVKRTLKRSLLLGLAVTLPAATFLIVFGKQIINLWVGPQIEPTLILLLGMGIWTVMGSVGGALSMFFNASGKIAFEVVCALLMAVSNLALSIFLTMRIGLPGPVYGSAIAQLIFVLIPSFLYIPRLLRSMQHKMPAAPQIEARLATE